MPEKNLQHGQEEKKKTHAARRRMGGARAELSICNSSSSCGKIMCYMGAHVEACRQGVHERKNLDMPAEVVTCMEVC